MNKFNSLLIILIFNLISFNALANTYKYNADVDGMVCAFCAYSVSKNIGKLPGVEADSINVDLKGGHVVFNSKNKISKTKLTALFSDSGFSLSNITFTKFDKPKNQITSEIILDLKIDAFKTDQFSGVIEALGNKAANTNSSLVIKAPASQEETILKPLLMGRQQVVKVQFVATESEKIQIQLFAN